MQVEVRQTGIISSKLSLVKLIKQHTGWGLKESKDWVDRFPFDAGEFCTSQSIDIADPIKFELDLKEIEGIKCSSTTQRRQRKLISIGLGDMEDKLDFLSQELTDDLVKNYGSGYSDYIRFFKDLVGDMDNNTIDSLVSKFSTNESNHS